MGSRERMNREHQSGLCCTDGSTNKLVLLWKQKNKKLGFQKSICSLFITVAFLNTATGGRRSGAFQTSTYSGFR